MTSSFNVCDPVVAEVLARVYAEQHGAASKFPPFNSAHEGFAILNEEVDELWQHVKVKQGQRDVDAMLAEAVQIAAMAIRFAVDLQGDRGQR